MSSTSNLILSFSQAERKRICKYPISSGFRAFSAIPTVIRRKWGKENGESKRVKRAKKAGAVVSNLAYNI